MVVRVTALALLAATLLVFAPSAQGYDEVGEPPESDCNACHNPGVEGVHGGYATSTRSCSTCHSIHSTDSESYKLLPGPTIVDSCNLCHDGTGGEGVYGAIEARLGTDTVQSAHRTDATALIPGGDTESGESTIGAFGGLGGTLSCGDCHSPHGARVVAAFRGDRPRADPNLPGYTSSRLLRRQPGGTQADVAVYGSDWCASCHAGRVVQHQVINHPVETSSTAGPGAFIYESVQVLRAAGSTSTVSGRLGRSNFGYVMPWPRTTGQGEHDPVCQQCHEDPRSVGDVIQGTVTIEETFTVTSLDGVNPSDNPRFQVFPHESTVEGMLIETRDDLCTNCHSAEQLD